MLWAIVGIYLLHVGGSVICRILCDFWRLSKALGRMLLAVARAFLRILPGNDRGNTSPKKTKNLDAEEVGELVKLGCSREAAEKLGAGDMDYLQGLSEKTAMVRLSMMDFTLSDKAAILERSQARSSKAVDWEQSNKSIVDDAIFSNASDRQLMIPSLPGRNGTPQQLDFDTPSGAGQLALSPKERKAVGELLLTLRKDQLSVAPSAGDTKIQPFSTPKTDPSTGGKVGAVKKTRRGELISDEQIVNDTALLNKEELKAANEEGTKWGKLGIDVGLPERQRMALLRGSLDPGEVGVWLTDVNLLLKGFRSADMGS